MAVVAVVVALGPLVRLLALLQVVLEVAVLVAIADLLVLQARPILVEAAVAAAHLDHLPMQVMQVVWVAQVLSCSTLVMFY
jgi:hypothetical protein